jgi:hypothetical protein
VFTIAVGFLIYFLQVKTDKSIRTAVERIDKYTDQMDKLQISLRFYPLATISSCLDFISDQLGEELRKIQDLKDNSASQLIYVNRVLAQHPYRFNLDIMLREIGFVRPFISGDFYFKIKGAIDRIKVLGGMAEFNFPFEESRVSGWIDLCRIAMPEIETVRMDINQFLVKENPDNAEK